MNMIRVGSGELGSVPLPEIGYYLYPHVESPNFMETPSGLGLCQDDGGCHCQNGLG